MYAFNLHIPFKFKECILQWFTGSQHGFSPLLLTNPKTQTHSIHSIHHTHSRHNTSIIIYYIMQPASNMMKQLNYYKISSDVIIIYISGMIWL